MLKTLIRTLQKGERKRDLIVTAYLSTVIGLFASLQVFNDLSLPI